MAQRTLILAHLVPKPSQLHNRMAIEDGNTKKSLRQIKNDIRKIPKTFFKYCKKCGEI